MLVVGGHTTTELELTGGCIFKGKTLISFGKVKLRHTPILNLEQITRTCLLIFSQRILIMCHSPSAEGFPPSSTECAYNCSKVTLG